MYNLHLTAEQLEIRDTVREFVAQEIRPAAIKPSRLEPLAKPLLLDALDQAARIGLRTLSLSEDAGGAGADTLTRCIAIEELAAGDPDIAAILAQTSTLADLLFNRAMNEAQRARLVEPFLADERYHLAFADEEPGAERTVGINYHRAETSSAPIQTTAARAGDGWVIDGRKVAVANAPLAKLFAVRAATGDGAVRTFLVPGDSAGLSVSDDGTIHRNYHGSRGTVTLNGCRVPADAVLDAESDDLEADTAELGAPLGLAINLGIGRAACEAALDYARLRVQGGRPIIEHQAIGTKLAEIAVRLEVARQTIWQAAWAADHPDAVADRSLPDLPLASIAKVFVSEAIYRATKDAAECFGAMGVMRDMPLQKYVHDARICLHAGAGNGELKLRLAERLAGFSRGGPTVMAAE
jgi:alkylation response protein AidB-like acyl-CoA dehydrogenase